MKQTKLASRNATILIIILGFAVALIGARVINPTEYQEAAKFTALALVVMIVGFLVALYGVYRSMAVRHEP